MWHLKSKWDNQNVAMAACWGPGMGVSYGLASVQKPNICMATVDYLDSKTEKKKLVRRQTMAVTKSYGEDYQGKISAVKINIYTTVHPQQQIILNKS